MQHYPDLLIHQDGCIAELMEGLSNADVAFLHSVLSKMSYSEWLTWYFEQAERIDQFLYSTVAARKKLLKGFSENERVLIPFGAIWNAQLASLIAGEMDNPSLFGKRDDRFRRAARAQIAVTACRALLEGDLEEWPFDEPPENPLKSNQS